MLALKHKPNLQLVEVEKEISCVILVQIYIYIYIDCCTSLYLWDSGCFMSKFLLQGTIYLLVIDTPVMYSIFVNSIKSSA